MEPLSITAAVTAAHHLSSLVKGITESIRASGKAEALNDVIELQMVMLDLIDKHQKVVLQNVQLQEEVKQLKAQQKLADALCFDSDKNWYHYKSHSGDVTDRFCSTCFDNTQKLIRLHHHKDRGYYFCRVCEGDFRA